MQLATGGGKTHIFACMTAASNQLGKVVWIVVPRNELVDQSSATLLKHKVKHGLIVAGSNESLAFKIHVVSAQTLIRRFDKIKRKPDFIIIDECHLALDRQLLISKNYPDAKILGVTATPEKLDGRGLSEMYETLVEGPPMAKLVELGYLTPVRYFAPETQDIDKLTRRGTDCDPDELASFLESKKIYGKTIEHYRKHADGKPALAFCRNLKMSKETAIRYSEAGYLFENIDGTMMKKKRRMLIGALREGDINGLTSCELITYGLDVPRIECVIMLRPTMSFTLFMQMIGRGLRPFEILYYVKKELVVIDHVGNLREHGHPLKPHVWDFNGTKKRGKTKKDKELIARLCPQIDFMYCDKPSCAGCEHNKEGKKSITYTMIDVELQEVQAPVKLRDRPIEQMRVIQDKINSAFDEYQTAYSSGIILPGPVGELLELARIIKRQPLWVYHKLNGESHMINKALLHEIARQKEYDPGWVWNQTTKIQGG